LLDISLKSFIKVYFLSTELMHNTLLRSMKWNPSQTIKTD